MIKRVNLSLENAAKDNQSLASNNDESLEDLSDDLRNIESDSTQEYFNAPVLWERISTGYRIVDLRSDHLSQALDLISSHFFNEEPICCATSLSNDAASLKSYRQFVTKNLVRGNGICAIREGIGRLVGVAVMSMCRETNEENREVHQESALSLAMTLKNDLLAETELEKEFYELEEYCRIDVLCVEPDHRGKGVATGLLRSCVAKIKSLNLSLCIGVFSSDTSRRIETELEKEFYELEEYCRIDVLCVEPDHRGKGVATGLLRSCVAKIKSLNLSLCIGVFSSDTSRRIETELEKKFHELEEYCRIDVLCVDPDHRGKGVAAGLLRSCVAKIKSLNLSLCIGVFSSDTSRRIASRLGFEKLGEIPYATYIPEDQGTNPFGNMGTGNYSLVCMVMKTISEAPKVSEHSPMSTSVVKKSKK